MYLYVKPKDAISYEAVGSLWPFPWVFHREGRPIQTFDRSWRTAINKAGIPNRIRHDFRRTATRNLEKPAADAMAMVGRKTDSTYRRYAISSEVGRPKSTSQAILSRTSFESARKRN